jgi:ribosomal protein S14
MSRGCNRCEVCGGRQTRSIFLSRQNAINLAVR